MRILHTSHFFLPQHGAGVEVYTDRLSRHQAREHEVHLFFTEKRHGHAQYELLSRRHGEVGCHVLVQNLLYRHVRETWEDPSAERAFEEVLDRVRPDVVHVQHLMGLSLGLPRLAARRGIPVVMTLHDFWLCCARMGQLRDHRGQRCEGPEAARCATCLGDVPFRQGPLAGGILRAIAWLRGHLGLDLGGISEGLARRRRRAAGAGLASAEDRPRVKGAPEAADLVHRQQAVLAMVPHVARFLVPSRTVRDHCVAQGVPADRVTLLPYGFVPPGPAAPARRTGSGSGLRVGFLGTLAPHKGAHVLVEAFRQADLGEAQLQIHGEDRSHPGYLQELRRRAGGARVHFGGRVPNEQVGEVLAGLDLLVVPSLWLENAPLVIQEARWAGVPVLASNLGGMAEAVRHEVDGYLFEAGDVAGLARALEHAARHPELREAWAHAAPPPMSMEEHAAHLIRAYTRQPAEETGG